MYSIYLDSVFAFGSKIIDKMACDREDLALISFAAVTRDTGPLFIKVAISCKEFTSNSSSSPKLLKPSSMEMKGCNTRSFPTFFKVSHYVLVIKYDYHVILYASLVKA